MEVRQFLALSLSVLMISVPAQAAVRGEPPATPPSAQTMTERSGSLICNLSVQTREWHQPQSVEVSLVIENRSKAERHMQVVPFFVLKPPVEAEEPLRTEPRYCALWDLERGTTLAVSKTVPLQLKPDDSRKITLDISKLLWSRMNWSVLPHSPLFRVVPAGRYSLHLELADNDGKVLCSSNTLEVLIK